MNPRNILSCFSKKLAIVTILLLSTLILVNSQTTVSATSASGRYGIAIATWGYPQTHNPASYSELLCYDFNGVRVQCNNAPPDRNNPQHLQVPYSPYQLNRRSFSDMQMTSYNGDNYQLANNTFNVSGHTTRDPKANTQFIWFHYENTGTMTRDEKINGAEIYTSSGAPGSLRVMVQKESSTIMSTKGAKPVQWRIRLPGIYDKNINGTNYPYCGGGGIECIFNKQELFNILDANINFTDTGSPGGNWYAFYLLAETEYGIISHYLEPREYAAAVNTYVEQLMSRYSSSRTPRFILSSPVVSVTTSNPFAETNPNNCHANTFYQTYFGQVYPYLSPQAKGAISFTSADIFLPPPPKPDYTLSGFSAVTSQELQNAAYCYANAAQEVASWFYTSTQTYLGAAKYTLLTQSGVNLYPAKVRDPNSLQYLHPERPTCGWCQSNNDVWSTTEFGTARLIHLFYSRLEDQAASGAKIAAWAYWGGMQQELWTDPLIMATWGDLYHGLYWLSWPALCTTQQGCPITTNKPWPSRPGMVYLELANGNRNYKPWTAPGQSLPLCWQ